MTDTIKTLQQQIVPILKKHQIKKASLFGSAIHDTMSQNSDIDILIQLQPHTSLFGYFKIQEELETTLKRPVDLVSYTSLHRRIKEKVLQEAVQIL